MNDVVKQETDLFAKYKDMFSTDRETTNSTRLSEEQKDLISKALNGVFVNPKFKMKYFVTSGQITPFSTIKQYFLELRALEEQFENYEKGIKQQELEVEVLELKIQQEQDLIKKKELEITLIEKRHNLRGNKRKAVQAHIEREQYLELIDEFNQLPEAKTPDGRLLMEVLGTPEENIYEQEYWVMRLARMAAMDISAYGRISAGNLDAIHQMPQEMTIRSLAIAHEINLRNDNMSFLVKNEVEKNLIANDPDFSEHKNITLVEHDNTEDRDDKGLLDVYNN